MSLHQRKGVDQCGQFDVPALGLAEAMKFAVQRINEDDSILPGLKLGYVIMDCCQSPVLGVKNVYKLALHNRQASLSNRSHPVVAVIGGLVSETALSVSTILQAVGLPIIGSLATSEQLSSKFHRTFLRTIPADGNQAKAISDIIEHFGWRYVAAIAEDDSYGRSGVLALQRESRKRQSFVVGISEFVLQSQYDRIPSIVYKLKERATVRVIILWMLHATGKAVLQEALRQNVVERTWIMSESISMQSAEHLGANIISRGNYIGVLPRRRVYEPFRKHILRFTPKTSIGNPWWEELWKEEFGCQPKDCARDVRVKGDFLMKLCNDYIPFVVDAVYALAHALDAIEKCKYPQGLLKGGRCPSGPISRVNSDDLYVYLRKTRFKGLTGMIEFDENGDPTDALFDIVYFNVNETHGNFTKVPLKTNIGSWGKKANRSLTLNSDLITWNGRKDPGPSECREECRPGKRKAITTAFCWECIGCAEGWITKESGQMNCSKCPWTQYSNSERTACVDLPLINVKWRDVSSMLLIIFSLLGVFLCLVVLVVLIKYKSTPLVKASSPEMCFLLLLATASCFMLSFLYIAEPTDVICATLQPLRYIIFTVSCSILGLKTVRIVHAFQMNTEKNFIKKLVKTASRQLFSLGVLFAIDIVLAFCWVAIDPPNLHISVTQDGYIFLSCEDFKRKSGKVMMMCMLCYMIVIALWSTFYSFRARNLPGNFNEAKYIAFSMYIILLSWIAYFPVGYALQGWYVAVVSCATSLVSGYGVLGCIFFPKLYVIFMHPGKNTRDSVRAELHVFSRVGTFIKSAKPRLASSRPVKLASNKR
ncbi:Extracellular calcium-sensing receptor [Exaiptasia diaphana]|nr:Extracellular calcium-sensing receptor [Exaiptasia diaphana]